MAKFAAKDSNKNITLSPHGNGKVVVGTGAAAATVQSDGNHNLVLQTGNSTTGSISITDGADGNIDISPNGTGEVNITKVDIDSGTIDGTTIATSDVTVGSGKTLDVSAGTLTSSTAQKTAIVDGGKGNLTKTDVGLSNVTNDAQVPASGGTFTGNVAVNGDLTVDTDTLKVDSANNRVGIGVTPSSKLELKDNTGGLSATEDITARFERGDGTYNPRLDIRHSTSGTDIRHTYGSSASNLSFSIASSKYLNIAGNGSITTPNSAEFNGTIGTSATGSANLGVVKTAINASGSAPIYAVRAWGNFDGTGSSPFTARGSANISSITKTSTSIYTVTFNTAMEDENYAVLAVSVSSTADRILVRIKNRAAGSFDLISNNNSFNDATANEIHFAVVH